MLLFASLVLNCEISEGVGAWRAGDVSSVPGSVEGAVHSLAIPCDGVCCLLLRFCVWRFSGFLSAALPISLLQDENLMAVPVPRRWCLAVLFK